MSFQKPLERPSQGHFLASFTLAPDRLVLPSGGTASSILRCDGGTWLSGVTGLPHPRFRKRSIRAKNTVNEECKSLINRRAAMAAHGASSAVNADRTAHECWLLRA